MLAAATTTGDWIVGIIAVLVIVAVVVGVVWLLWRLVTWPARARRRRASTGGAGADYERMIREQRRRGLHAEARLPFPPHPQTSQPVPTAAPSRVVLPPPSYRTREPELAVPEAQPPLPPAATNGSPPLSPWQRLARRMVRIPAWVTVSLAWLGLAFLVLKPLGMMDWVGYGVFVVFAVIIAVYTRAHYHSKVLWRGERQGVVWVRWGKADAAAEPPVVVTPASDDTPTSVQTPTQT
jgi:hypothetical protein